MSYSKECLSGTDNGDLKTRMVTNFTKISASVLHTKGIYTFLERFRSRSINAYNVKTIFLNAQSDCFVSGLQV